MMDEALKAFSLLLSLFSLGRVGSATDNREALYYQEKGCSLSNHTIKSLIVHDAIECGLQCTRTSLCKSMNYQHGDIQRHLCQLNSKSKGSASSADYRADSGVTYYERDPCFPSPCSYAGTCSKVNGIDEFKCSCLPGYKGRLCELERLGWFSRKPGSSCKAILANGDGLHDGAYWIDPGNAGSPIHVYCDMSSNGGGWLMVSNLVIANPAQFPPTALTSSFSDISNYNNNHTLISSTNLRELQQLMPFSQLRFQCRKSVVGRMVHIITSLNSSGSNVVQYFTSQTNTLPMACGSFTRGSGDNSVLAGDCAKWGNDGSQFVGKWAHFKKKDEWRLFDHTMFIANANHWVVRSYGIRCDANTVSFSPGDFWKIYVR